MLPLLPRKKQKVSLLLPKAPAIKVTTIYRAGHTSSVPDFQIHGLTEASEASPTHTASKRSTCFIDKLETSGALNLNHHQHLHQQLTSPLA